MRNGYDLIALNSEIDALDNKIAGKAQLDLYAAVQDLLLDRLVWFLRNVDLKRGLETIVAHYRAGIAQVAAALDSALSQPALAARNAAVAELAKAGVPEALARRIASLPVLLDPKGAAARAWRVRGVPTSVIIDRKGRERARVEGAADWSTPTAAATVRKLVAV